MFERIQVVAKLRQSVSSLSSGRGSSKGDVGFMVDNVAMGQVSSITSASPVNSHSTNFSIQIGHPIIDANLQYILKW
jgi:hypothetical protein